MLGDMPPLSHGVFFPLTLLLLFLENVAVKSLLLLGL
jgi:hypothetical protein